MLIVGVWQALGKTSDDSPQNVTRRPLPRIFSSILPFSLGSALVLIHAPIERHRPVSVFDYPGARSGARKQYERPTFHRWTPRPFIYSKNTGQSDASLSPNIKDYLEQADRGGSFLDEVSPATTPPTTLHESMRYSLMAGGKRVRPILTIAAAEALGTTPPGLMAVACSLEFIHTYSLIHDDLPSMDNDDFRRGKPTNHKVYGEAMAILAGDALLTMAFDLCSRPDLMKGCDPVRQVRLIQELAYGSGNAGMVGGQVFDIQAEHKDIDLPTLQNIHKHKTGMLMRAAVRMGAIAAGATDRQLDDMTGYAEDIGLAFQIADDVLNVTGTREELGKNPNTDAERGKKTYPIFYGVDGARKLADDCVTRAINRLSSFGPSADPLREIARYITSRRN
jgi:geranylgeranyl diphosphate synthase type II